MSVFFLHEDSCSFPDPESADEDGLIAVSENLSTQQLIASYASGIFPWFQEEDLFFWFSPDPRCILYPHQISISKSMHQLIKKNYFQVTFDKHFSFVIQQCANTKRKEENNSSWINENFISAFTSLHEKGIAHSVEVWREDKIVGGLYGLSIGSCFFGESMFSTESNASKFGFIYLAQYLRNHSFLFIDCQLPTPHLKSMGAIEMKRTNYLQVLKTGLQKKSVIGDWNNTYNWYNKKDISI